MGVTVEIEKLERQLDQVRAELHAENQRGALKDSNKVAELEQKMADLSQQLDVEMRLAETKVHEQRVEESQAEIFNALDNLRVENTSIRELFFNQTAEEAEAAYQLVSAVWKQETAEIVAKHLQSYQDLEQQLNQERREKAELQARYDQMYEEHAEQRKALNEVRFELEETSAKRDAAVNQIDELNEEIKRLNGQVDDLRKEIAVGAANAPKVIDVKDAHAQYLEQKRKAEAAKPAIYDVTLLDNRRARFGAKFAETGQYFEDYYIYLEGKYRVVSAQEAGVFRTEYEAKRNQESAEVDAGHGVDVDPNQFQEADSSVNGLDQADESLEVAGEDVTLEQRVAALERAVFGEVKGAA